jgi:O-antigen ligase
MAAAPQRAPIPAGPPASAIIAAGLGAALLVGLALAAKLPYGIALLIAPCYVAIVLINLQLGLVLWVPLIFLEGIFAFNVAGKGAGLLVALAWLGSWRIMRTQRLEALRGHRVLFLSILGLLAWFTFSIAWADDAGAALSDVWHWYVLGLVFVIVATTVNSAHVVRMVLAAFVVGATLSVAIGAIDGSLTSAVDGGARFQGTAGDPNFLAASLIAATVLAGALIAETRSVLWRVLLVSAIAILIAGLVASESRGGFLAAGVTVIAAFVLFKRQRLQVAAMAAIVLGLAALTFVNSPDTWQRVTSFDNDNGRSDLWTVAWRMGNDQPLTGVGINNFTVHAPDYVRDAGSLSHVELIAERPHFVHNTYLQLYADGGIVAVALFLVMVGSCLHAGKRAADLFDAQRRRSLATMARAVMVATISMLAAALFLSAQPDKRLWLLLALGPALLSVARMGRPGDERADRSADRLVPRTASAPRRTASPAALGP